LVGDLFFVEPEEEGLRRAEKNLVKFKKKWSSKGRLACGGRFVLTESAGKGVSEGNCFFCRREPNEEIGRQIPDPVLRSSLGLSSESEHIVGLLGVTRKMLRGRPNRSRKGTPPGGRGHLFKRGKTLEVVQPYFGVTFGIVVMGVSNDCGSGRE